MFLEGEKLLRALQSKSIVDRECGCEPENENPLGREYRDGGMRVRDVRRRGDEDGRRGRRRRVSE